MQHKGAAVKLQVHITHQSCDGGVSLKQYDCLAHGVQVLVFCYTTCVLALRVFTLRHVDRGGTAVAAFMRLNFSIPRAADRNAETWKIQISQVSFKNGAAAGTVSAVHMPVYACADG